MSHLGPYILSLFAGLFVGAVYAGLSIRSPAPPIIALLGLLGMLAGEAGMHWLKGHKNFVQVFLHEKSFAVQKRHKTAKDRDAA